VVFGGSAVPLSKHHGVPTLSLQNVEGPRHHGAVTPDSGVAKIVTVAAYKGGVGKTTLALELAYLLEAPLVDFEWDAGGASHRWGYRHDKHKTRPLLDALLRQSAPKPIPGRRKPDLVPGHPDLSDAALEAEDVSTSLVKWASEWGRDWTVVDTHPGGFPSTLGAMAAADVVVVPTPLRTSELDALEGMLSEASDYPLLIVPTMVGRAPSASLNRRLWALSERFDVPIGPVISEYRGLGDRQQRISVTALDPLPARWSSYVDELQAFADAVRSYGDD
jgi:chromosome partitioning protein